ncbi:MAG: hypothetical protein ABIL62_09890 [Planctomycetota bacterium]
MGDVGVFFGTDFTPVPSAGATGQADFTDPSSLSAMTDRLFFVQRDSGFRLSILRSSTATEDGRPFDKLRATPRQGVKAGKAKTTSSPSGI